MTLRSRPVADPLEHTGPALLPSREPSSAAGREARPSVPGQRREGDGSSRGARPLQPRRVVFALSSSSFIEWAGAGAILPLLPLYLRREGASDLVIGVAMAAFFLTGVVVQYPAGRLADRIGRRPLLIAGLVIYALASLAFLGLSSPLAAVAWRGLQGAGSGVTGSTNAAVMGETVPEAVRGRAFGALNGAITAGLAVGPLIGSLIGVGSMRTVFLLAGLAALAAVIPVLVVLPAGRFVAATSTRERRHLPLRQNRAVLGALAAVGAAGLISGVYEVCWTLLLALRHAHSWEIGLSWTLFAVPFVAVSVPAGWLVDHVDRRSLAVISLLVSAGFACTYPFLPSLALIVGLGSFEAIAVALAFPAVLSILTEHVAPEMMGRAQGLTGSVQTGATAVAALAAGALFSVTPPLPFVLGGAGVVACTVVMVLSWRGVPGRVGSAAAETVETGGS
jgi:MFS family permease